MVAKNSPSPATPAPSPRVTIDLVCVSATLDPDSTPAQIAEAVRNLNGAALAVFEIGSEDLSAAGWAGLFLLRQANALAAELHVRLERAEPPQ